MRVITKCVWDMASLVMIECVSVPYDGPWEQCKADDAQKKAQNEQIDFNNVLLSTYKQAFAESQSILGLITPQLEHMAASPEGFGATEYAALQAKIVNDTGAQFSNVAKSAAREFATTNEKGLPSGVEAQTEAGIAAAAAGQVSGESTSLAIANEQMKQQQRDFALSSLTGIQAGEAQTGVAVGGQEGSGIQSQFQNATTVHNQGSMWKNILSGVVGAGLDFATGGLSNILGGGSFLKPAGAGGGGGGGCCWVASELYGGRYSPETVAIFDWIWRTWWMRPFSWFYTKFGPAWAEWIRRNMLARKVTKQLFDWFLVKANQSASVTG